MTIFVVLAPYGAFAFLMLVCSATASLFAAAAICLTVIAWDMPCAVSRPRLLASVTSNSSAASF